MPSLHTHHWHIEVICCIRNSAKQNMGYVRLRIKELAEQRSWTLKEVADYAGVNYNTVRRYVQRDMLNTVDLSAVFKIARAFDVSIEDLVEILEE